MVSIVSAVRDLGRLREIYVVLVRHGFGELAQRLGLGKRGKALPAATDEAGRVLEDAVPEAEAKRGEEESQKISLPERVRLVLMDLGPSFVKLGQIASTRPDVLPPEWIVSLKKLQDEVNPLAFEEIRAAVESSLGAPIEEVYERFDTKPLAAASIGQVHRALLKNAEGGEPHEVVVKVQRPGVRETVARDLDILHKLARLVEQTIPESSIYSPSALVNQFDRAITAELDYGLEADNAERFAKNFEGHPHARFPKVYRAASTKQVLTLEFLRGKKVYDAIRLDGHEGPVIARIGANVVVKMIFEDGFFHADPHPGNILIAGEPKHPVFGLVDVGMVGRLSPEMRDKTVDMMVAAVRQDQAALADALYAIGTPTKKVDMRAYRAEVAELSDKYLGRPLKEIDLSAMIADLVRGATKYGIEIPADFLLVGKALMTIEGVGKEIDPDLDVFTEIRPYFLELLRRRYSPERVLMEGWRGLERFSGAAYDLPQQAREVLEELRLGRLVVRTSDPALPAVADRLGRRMFAGLVVAGWAIAGAWLVGAAHDVAGAVVLALAGVVLVVHLAADVLRKRP
jgi:ubiquinone biosynthesis protein